MKKNRTFKKQKGVALGYVLMALVCVGAISMLVLNMAKKETVDNSLRSSSETARFTATAGLTYATNYFTNPANKDDVLDLLQGWYEKHNDPSASEPRKWIAGNANSYLEDNDMKFRVKIVGVDFSGVQAVTDPDGKFKTGKSADDSKIVVLFESESKDKSGSRAINFGSYTLLGFETNAKDGAYPTHAFYLGRGDMWIHCPVTINGDTYVGKKNSIPGTTAIKHNQSSSTPDGATSYYNGEFRLYQSSPADTVELADEVFNGPAYFESGTVLFSFYNTYNSQFNQGFGGSAIFHTQGGNASVKTGYPAIFSNDAQFKTTSSYKLNFAANCSLIYVPSSNFAAGFYSGTTPGIRTPSNISNVNVLNKLGMDPQEPPACIIDLKEITDNEAQYIYDFTTASVTGATLNNWYNNPSMRGGKQLYKNWMVLRTTKQQTDTFVGMGAGFTGKAIIIYRGSGGTGNYQTGTLPQVDDNGMILFYIPEQDAVNGSFTFSQVQGKFRGLFYNASPNSRVSISVIGTNSGWGTVGNWTVKGGFYNAGKIKGTANNSLIQLGAGGAGRVTITYDPEVMDALKELGVLKPDMDASSPDNPPELVQIPTTLFPKVKAELLSRSF